MAHQVRPVNAIKFVLVRGEHRIRGTGFGLTFGIGGDISGRLLSLGILAAALLQWTLFGLGTCTLACVVLLIVRAPSLNISVRSA